MNFDELKRKRIVEELDYSFEVEEDYCDWELALDGIETIKTELRKLTDYT
jgi:hypothetical protein